MYKDLHTLTFILDVINHKSILIDFDSTNLKYIIYLVQFYYY